jgi:histidine kinase/histidine kinase/DNA gyrase B/HSP90-like ATPase
MCGALAGQRRLLLLTLRERNRYLEHAQQLAETRSRLRERARIAREMHDLLGHRLTLITLYAGGLEYTTSRRAPDLSEEAGVIATTARSAMGELRDVLSVLRDEPGPHPAEDGPANVTGGSSLEEDVRDLVTDSRRAGLPVELRWRRDGDTDPAPVVRRAVHRVVRESLTNVHKHAQAAAEVEVVVDTGPESIRIAVRNSAVESEERPAERLPGSGSGLAGLEERVRLLGGTLRHGEDRSGGFVVEAELPAFGPGATAHDGTAADGPADAAAGTRPEEAEADEPLPAPETVPEVPAEAMPGRLRGAWGRVAALLVILAGIAALGLWIVSEFRQASTNGERYRQVRTGMTRAEVERITGALVEGGDAQELRAREPARPRDAGCAYALGVADHSAVAYRYCFRAGHLVEKTTYPVTDRRPPGRVSAG